MSIDDLNKMAGALDNALHKGNLPLPMIEKNPSGVNCRCFEKIEPWSIHDGNIIDDMNAFVDHITETPEKYRRLIQGEWVTE